MWKIYVKYVVAFAVLGVVAWYWPVCAQAQATKATPVVDKELSADQIIDKAQENRKLDGAESLQTLTIYNEKGDKRVRRMAGVSKLYDNGDTEKRLMRFTHPADVKGTGLLTYDYEKKDDDIWLFLPSLRKTRRIVSSEKSKSFMGSEFSYADMTPPPVEDFVHKKQKVETVDGVVCWVVESTARSEDIAEENGYLKRVSWIGQADFVVRKAVYNDLDGELLKVLTTKNIKEIDTKRHRFRPLYMEMNNKQNGRKSVFETNQIEIQEGVKDDYFTTRYLERQ